MKTKIIISAVMLVAGLSLATANESLVGMLLPSKTNAKGKVTEVKLQVQDGENDDGLPIYKVYNIKNQGKGKELLDKVETMVSVKGDVTNDKKGNYFLTVKSYEDVEAMEYGDDDSGAGAEGDTNDMEESEIE